ncbi:MAG: patatin-like phospholipase family protein [Peptoniphilus sp.]|nr:patatin-like phospholipase family protein [Peptoniphilus sp.]MDY3118172.1 patatin-like phospholipase family protein [Peptoniphilus sp.]
MAKGLVLEGGGAKGSYQLGLYRAVQEIHPDIRLVVGTSMGALTGAFIVQGNTDVLADIWQKTSFDGSRELMLSLDQVKKTPDLLRIAKTARAVFHVDMAPLKEMIHRHVDEEKIRAAEVDYGLVVYSVSEGKTKFLYLDDIPEGKLNQYILASCAYPIFPPVKIDGKLYVDGGVGNNLPYEMVLARGLDPLILRTNPPKEGEEFPENATVLGPLRPIADTLHFDSALAPERMQQGYRHGRRILMGYDGLDYTFYPLSEREAFNRLGELFFARGEDFRYLSKAKGSSERGIVENLWPELAEALGLSEEYSYKALFIGLLEARGEQIHLPKDPFYTVDGFLSALEEKSHVHPRMQTTLDRVLYLLFCGKRLAIE